MVFSSNIFLFLFLPILLLHYFLIPDKAKNISIKNFILLIFSLFFYAFGEIHYLALLIFLIFGNYFFGIGIEKSLLTSNNNKKLAKLIISIAVSFNLILLCYFKYANFLIENLNLAFGFKIQNKEILLPIGISFFTFHAISYLVDIYRGKCKSQKNIFNLTLYISFFPQLIAGPIVRYNFIEKYLTKRHQNLTFISFGIRVFIIGLAKKVLIANPLGEVADEVFSTDNNHLNSIIALAGIICYTMQIYFDFSGYSDMAVGLARIFGFKFPVNFNYPYISSSIKEFWRRWHISLSSWFRDYLYIPLGGNRVSVKRQYFNLFLVFFLCGLWHGASWNFIVWGIFHGFFLVIERFKFYQKFLGFLPKIIANFYTLFLVMIGWIFFKSSNLSYALAFIENIFTNFNQVEISLELNRLLKSHLVATSLIAAIIGSFPFVKNLAIKLIRKNRNYLFLLDSFLIGIFLLAIIRLSSMTHNPFIYFQF
jgi:alginate O-acetyltransferase complex protein AlgI